VRAAGIYKVYAGWCFKLYLK